MGKKSAISGLTVTAVGINSAPDSCLLSEGVPTFCDPSGDKGWSNLFEGPEKLRVVCRWRAYLEFGVAMGPSAKAEGSRAIMRRAMGQAGNRAAKIVPP